jgi:hypothetical protein
MTCVPASLVGFDNKAAKRGEAIFEDVRDNVRASDVVHADETSWRNDGKGHFVWFAGNDDLAFFHIGHELRHLFTFLRIPGVPPTNNHAKQSLRKMVIMRKVSFGSRSDSGLKTHSIIPTLVQRVSIRDNFCTSSISPTPP